MQRSTTARTAFLVAGFFLAVTSSLYVYGVNYETLLLRTLPSIIATEQQWPELEFSWRIVVATVIGFLGSACGIVGGVGGGGIFVPMLTMIIGFDTKSAAALSKCMIMGASTSSIWYNLMAQHPTSDVPIIDYSLALLFQPLLMLGITIGVALSVTFPYWLITILTVILFVGTSSRSFCKGKEIWRQETIFKVSRQNVETLAKCRSESLMEENCGPLIPHPKEEKTKWQLIWFNLRWKKAALLVVLWICFLLIQIFKNNVPVCGPWYWVLFNVQFPIALAVYGTEAFKLFKHYQRRESTGDIESLSDASIEWTVLNLAICAFCSILGGVVGGLLGSGGGFILGPLLLEIGVIPQVASATATFVMAFSSSLSVVEFYLLKRFPIPYALYLIAVSVVAGFWGQFVVRKVMALLGRASIIVFILSAVIFTSAITMGIAGIVRSIDMIKNHDFMGFLDFCSNQ